MLWRRRLGVPSPFRPLANGDIGDKRGIRVCCYCAARHYLWSSYVVVVTAGATVAVIFVDLVVAVVAAAAAVNSSLRYPARFDGTHLLPLLVGTIA